MPNFPDQYEVKPLAGPFDATGDHAVRVPGSKSLTNRALLLAALAEGTTTLTGVLFADDTRRMMEALDTLGFELEIDETTATVTLHGQGGVLPDLDDDTQLFLGNAGTAMRFLTAACALGTRNSSYTLDGIPRMRERPLGELVDLLRRLGATIDYLAQDGFPPVRIHGGLRETLAQRDDTPELKVATTLSSQYVSALLQIAPCLPHGLKLKFTGPITSRPYVWMTQRMMHAFGSDHPSTDDAITVSNINYTTPGEYPIEPDASNASYFLAAAAVIPDSRCEIPGLEADSLQGDSLFIKALGRLGVLSGYHGKGDCISVQPRSPRLRGCTHNLADMPDMAQTLAGVALFADGPTTITHVGNLRVKETDRLAALQNELTKLGATVTIDGDDITITPPPEDEAALPFKPGGIVEIDTYDDHRMAMSFAVAGLASDKLPGRPRIVINDPGCVAKTYPNFFDDLRRYLGASVVDPASATA